MHTQWNEKLLDGTTVLIRPIRAEDAERERRFIEKLSPESRYFRFLEGMRSPSPALVKQLTDVDHTRNEAYVALIGSGAEQQQIGVSRFCRVDDETGECAVVVSDAYQHKGLGTLLMRHLIEVARERGIKTLYSVDAVDNYSMRDFATRLGFTLQTDPDDSKLVRHTLKLDPTHA